MTGFLPLLGSPALLREPSLCVLPSTSGEITRSPEQVVAGGRRPAENWLASRLNSVIGGQEAASVMSARIVHLAPCDDSEYADFASRQVVEYASQLARAGEVPSERSFAVAQERLEGLCADRLRSLGHEFFAARSVPGAARVGWVWLSPPPPFLGPGHERTRWLSQLTVEELQRGQGWGHAILDAVEQYELTRGSQAIWLRVFDWNTIARRLYQSHGYELARQFTVEAHFCKPLRR